MLNFLFCLIDSKDVFREIFVLRLLDFYCCACSMLDMISRCPQSFAKSYC